MSILKPGTLCIIIGGCPQNIGMVVQVIEHLGRHYEREDAYCIKTVTGRKFKQLWINGRLTAGYADEAVTDRHKLRPLVASDEKFEELSIEHELDATW